MNTFDNIIIALTALRTNLMRSILTTLGIIIGVSAVILMVALGNGLQGLVINQVNSLGSNLIIVIPDSDGGRRSSQDGVLTERDADAIQREIPEVSAASPRLSKSVKVVAGNQNRSTQLAGADPDFVAVNNWDIVTGRNFTVAEARSGAKVALIGDTVREELFGDVDPVGLTFRANGTPLMVIGLLGAKGGGLGNDQDDLIVVPLTTARRRISGGLQTAGPPDAVQVIFVAFQEGSDMNRAKEDVENVLRSRYRIDEDELPSFSAFSMEEQLRSAESILGAFKIGLAGVAAISLVVGGIGIMNIMLVSVTERTREIGLRMAVGARTRDIRLQFLVEAIVLCVIGGLIGLAIGGGGALAMRNVLPDWPITIGAGTVALAIGVSAAVGLGFGLYPANRAAKLIPIDALRHE
ncbi:ABC transporter permease [Pacificimonas sp. WHA3]|uniref:ABC transporter permease n=1 Tax=Pacificimonas pallii TaxID=2827236 RepID=A0ABS6SBN5_9SPHN|nr:ABC transporter permease [Pacificimonas pallii]MBV7255832.1 ABC transporter permease [Pacificimonas pallii]